MIVALFSGTLFLSAGLVFLVQPMFAKFILPLFGSTPAVWNASMLFFQTTLLAGYLYAHETTRRLGVRRQAALHVGVLLLPLLVLPLAIPAVIFGAAAIEAAASGLPARPMLLLLGALVAAALPLAPLAAGAALREG